MRALYRLYLSVCHWLNSYFVARETERWLDRRKERTPQQLADLEEYQRTGLNPAFKRVVEDIEPAVFSEVTGASVFFNAWNEEGPYMLGILAGDSHKHVGYATRRDGTYARYKTAASARSAKSRFLKSRGLKP